jgi:hypothetical protein
VRQLSSPITECLIGTLQAQGTVQLYRTHDIIRGGRLEGTAPLCVLDRVVQSTYIPVRVCFLLNLSSTCGRLRRRILGVGNARNYIILTLAECDPRQARRFFGRVRNDTVPCCEGTYYVAPQCRPDGRVASATLFLSLPVDTCKKKHFVYFIFSYKVLDAKCLKFLYAYTTDHICAFSSTIAHG